MNLIGQNGLTEPRSKSARDKLARLTRANGICLCVAMLMVYAAGCGGPKPTRAPAAGDTRQANAGSAETSDEIDLTLVPGRIHVVKPRETLWSLSEMYYGNNRQWRKILVANRRRVTDPTNLPVGMKLIIP